MSFEPIDIEVNENIHLGRVGSLVGNDDCVLRRRKADVPYTKFYLSLSPW